MSAVTDSSGIPAPVRLEHEEIERLFLNGPLGMIRVDAQDRILSLNPAAQFMIGLSEKMLQGSTLTELIPESDRGNYVRLRETLMSGRVSHEQTESRLARLNDAPLCASMTAFALTGDGIEGVNLVIIIQDITERKRAEERKRASEEHWRALWVNVPDHIMELDRDHNILLWNHEGTGLAQEPLIGRSFFDITPPQKADAVRRILERAWETGNIANYEIRRRSGGRTKWWACRVIPVVENGHAVRMLHISSDITAVKQTENVRARIHRRLEERVEARTGELRAALQEKEVLLREVHHRVKNNLQIISSLLRLQARRIGDAATGNVFVESQRRVESMAKIHEYLYRSDHFRRIDFNAYLRDLGSQLVQAYGQNDPHVQLEIYGGNVDLSVDEAIPCGLIFSEAISNSLKHAFGERESGVINVSFHRPDPGHLAMLIKDNGRGFPPEFDSDSAASLGLKLVRQLTDQLGGELEIFSSDGAALRITFPFSGVPLEGE